jgi:hypothetical protein
VLWNTLGSATEVQHSAVGPNLDFYKDSDCTPQTCFAGSGIDVHGVPAFVPGKFGNALTIGEGGYLSEQREHTVVLRNAQTVVNTERGTIDVWYQQNVDPVPFENGDYRLFDGAFGLEHEQIGLFADDRPAPDGHLQFFLRMGAAEPVGVVSRTDGELGAPMLSFRQRWIHILAMWDRAGIDGTTDSMRLYIDGTLVASTTARNWGTVPPTIVDIAGGNDFRIARTFFEDELKLWNMANTPPRCGITRLAGPPTQVKATIQTNRAGLDSVVVTKAVNASVVVPTFTPGTTAPLTVAATKQNQTATSQVELRLTDRAGNVTTCDPVLALVSAQGDSSRQTFTDIPPSEHVISISNGSPGLRHLEVRLNGRRFDVDLRAAQEQTLDIGSAMRTGANTLEVVAHGPRRGAAELMIWDGN